MSKKRAVIEIVDELLKSGKITEPFTADDVEKAYKDNENLKNEYPVKGNTINTDLSNLDLNNCKFISVSKNPYKYCRIQK